MVPPSIVDRTVAIDDDNSQVELLAPKFGTGLFTNDRGQM
jgi:hypothetical protein